MGTCGWRRRHRSKPRKSRWPTRPPATMVSEGASSAVWRIPLFNLIVWILTRYDHIVYVAFSQTSHRDPHEPGAFLQLRKRSYATVTHAAHEPAHQLVRQRGERTLIRHAPLDALRH